MDGWMRNEIRDISRNSSSSSSESAGCVIFIAVVGITVRLTQFLYKKVPTWTKSLPEVDSKLLYKILLFLLVILLGYLFFQFKKKNQYLYGACETSFAFTSTWLACDKLFADMHDNTLRIAVASSIYLIVRGLSNMKEAKEKKVADKKWSDNPGYP